MITQQLAEFALADCDVPDPIEMTRLSIFDWAACGIAGRDEPVSRLLRETVLAEAGAAQAHLFGGGAAPMRGAALVNGGASHALDYDDTHFAHIGHPSVVVVSAALAVAEHMQASDDAFVQACLAGIEASTRIGIWLGRGHYQMGFHQTGTAGCFGAAIAAARLLGCDAQQLGHAIGLASTKAAGLKSQFGTMGKPYNAGAAAAAGVEVAQLARAGFVSNPQGLEAAQGFGETHGGAQDMRAFDGLGRVWLIEEISHKFHACCHGTHAMIEALRDVSVAPREVARIDVQTHPRWLKVCDQPVPRTGLEVKFSYRMIAALVLAGYDTAALETFSDRLANDPALCEMRDKVTVSGDETMPETGAVLTITHHDGSTTHAQADIAAPISLATRREKLEMKAQALLGGQMDQLRSAVLDGASVDVAGFADLLGQGH